MSIEVTIDRKCINHCPMQVYFDVRLNVDHTAYMRLSGYAERFSKTIWLTTCVHWKKLAYTLNKLRML